jgi:hypothetical protein
MSRSPFPLIAMTAAGTLALAACAPFGTLFRQPPSARVTTHDRTARWSGTLAPLSTRPGPAGTVPAHGTAAMRLGPDGWSTHVAVDLANAAPGSVHPWQLRHGRCGQDSGVFGMSDAYEALMVDAQGRASSAVTVPLLMPTEGPYFVSVSASAADPETIVACGNLAAPSR